MTGIVGIANAVTLKIHQIATRSSPIIEELLRYQVRDDSHISAAEYQFHEKAIKSLVRKLKKTRTRPSQVERLVKTIQDKTASYGCLLIPRSLDGRMQVSQRKVLPHVLYAQIWRYPDLGSHHELKSVICCRNGYGLKKDEVCINPYHYERIHSQSKKIQPVLVPRLPPTAIPAKFASFATVYNPIEDLEDEWVVAKNFTYDSHQRKLIDCYEPGYLSEDMSAPTSPTSVSDSISSSTGGYHNTGNSPANGMTATSTTMPPSAENQRTSVIKQNSQFFEKFEEMDIKSEIIKTEYTDTQTTTSETASASSSYTSPTTDIKSEPVFGHEEVGSRQQSESSRTNSGSFGDNEFETSIKDEMDSGSPDDDDDDNTDEYIDVIGVCENTNDFIKIEPQENPSIEPRTQVGWEEPPEWCTIHYYELNQRYGEPFNCTYPIVKIDGWTNPHSDGRFCLGSVPNAQRSREIELVRRNIGAGIELIYEMGKISLKNISDSSVFIQSPQMNYNWSLDPKTVIKIPAGHEADIFDNEKFAKSLGEAVEYNFEAVYKMNSLCTLRLSFVKGWGSDYRRAHVTSTPCWVEIYLNGQLQWLDRILREMGGPKTTMTSFS